MTTKPRVVYEGRYPLLLLEPFQITKAVRADNSSWPGWMHRAWNKPKKERGAVWPARATVNGPLCVRTSQGIVHVPWDHYIVRNRVDESLYVIDRSLLHRLFREVRT